MNKDTEITEEQEELKNKLVAAYGEVLTTAEATEKYEFKSFAAPFAIVRDKETGKEGALEFTHMPRFYFNFVSN